MGFRWMDAYGEFLSDLRAGERVFRLLDGDFRVLVAQRVLQIHICERRAREGEGGRARERGRERGWAWTQEKHRQNRLKLKP